MKTKQNIKKKKWREGTNRQVDNADTSAVANLHTEQKKKKCVPRPCG